MNDAVIHLAQTCHSLRKAQFQATSNLNDSALLAFFENCLNLTLLEITGAFRDVSRWKVEVLETLVQHLECIFNLKKPTLKEGSTRNIKATREVTKQKGKGGEVGRLGIGGDQDQIREKVQAARQAKRL